jgi:DUF4097 and DUF4098 domain-containing protein YvlB
MKRLTVIAFALVLFAFSIPAWAADTIKEREEFHQTYNINANGSLSLGNINGEVAIKVWDEPRVQLNAVKLGPDKERLALVKIDVKASADRIDIDTVYPKNVRNVNVAVEYQLTVPRNINLEKINTVNGSVNIAGVQGRIEAETVNGSINIEGGNTISAETVNGSIKATLQHLSGSEHAKFNTVNGSITLFMDENIGAELDASTVNGKINTDFPLTVKGKLSSKRLHGQLGSGGAKLSLETVNGSIHLSRAGV